MSKTATIEEGRIQETLRMAFPKEIAEEAARSMAMAGVYAKDLFSRNPIPASLRVSL